MSRQCVICGENVSSRNGNRIVCGDALDKTSCAYERVKQLSNKRQKDYRKSKNDEFDYIDGYCEAAKSSGYF
jgi:hypothetical protein